MQTKFLELVRSGQLGFAMKISAYSTMNEVFQPFLDKVTEVFFAVKERVQQCVEKLCKMSVLELCINSEVNCLSPQVVTWREKMKNFLLVWSRWCTESFQKGPILPDQLLININLKKLWMRLFKKYLANA